MTLNRRFFITLSTAILLIILVFMNFLGYWQADPAIQIIFFFIMVSAIFSAGIETSKKLTFKS